MTGLPKAQNDLASWDAAADAYARTGATVPPRFAQFLADAIGDPAGLDVLDVGCGHGWYTDALSRQGANAVGVDGSSRLLDIARRNHPTTDFAWADLTEGLPAPVRSRRFDRIVALMVLMDLPTLDPLLRDVAACLRPSGRVVITLTHPAFFSHCPVEDAGTGERYRKVTGYLAPEERWIMSFGGHRHYHRPLGWYVDNLASHGLAVTRLYEPPTPPPECGSAAYGQWFSTIPTMLGLVARPLADAR